MGSASEFLGVEGQAAADGFDGCHCVVPPCLKGVHKHKKMVEKMEYWRRSGKVWCVGGWLPEVIIFKFSGTQKSYFC